MIKQVFDGYPVENPLQLESYGNFRDAFEAGTRHSTAVASIAVGGLGVCAEATLVVVAAKTKAKWDNIGYGVLSIIMIEALLAVADNIATEEREGKAVVNMSWGLKLGGQQGKEKQDLLCKLGLRLYPSLKTILADPHFLSAVKILKLLDALDVVLVAAAGNDAPNSPSIDSYPSLFLKDGSLPNLVVVGAADGYSKRASFSQSGEITTYGPGQQILVAAPGGDTRLADGTSYGK